MKKINEGFKCINCGTSIPPAKSTCRNHCPHCFTSLHVDGDIPGDRNTICHGNMYPIEYKVVNSDYKVLFKCSKCDKTHRNKRSIDDEISNLPLFIEKYKLYFKDSSK